MKKALSVFIILILLIGFSSCGDNKTSENSNKISNEYIENMNNIDTVISYSTNIVKAKLLSTEDFDGYVNVYTFEIEEDFTGNTPNQIHMYDEVNAQYIKDHSYYLFLCANDNALYPHTIYTTVYKDLVIETDKLINLPNQKSTISTSELNSIINKAVVNNSVGAKNQNLPELTEATTIQSVSEEADFVGKIKLTDEVPINIYVSQYKVVSVDAMKGNASNIGEYILLEPNLQLNTELYVFMADDPTATGGYVLFSREIQAIPTSEISIDEFVLQ